MNNTQSIIVYRNPIEQQFWESGLLIPIMAGMIVVVLTMVVSDAIFSKFIRKYSPTFGKIMNVMLWVSIVAGGYTTYSLI